MSKRLFVHIETDCKTARNMKCGANRTKTSIFSQQYFGFLSKNISLDRLDCIVRTKKCKANGTGIDIRPKEAHYQDEKIKWRDFKSNILPVNKRRKINDVNKYTRTQTYGNIWIRNVPFSRRLPSLWFVLSMNGGSEEGRPTTSSTPMALHLHQIVKSRHLR